MIHLFHVKKKIEKLISTKRSSGREALYHHSFSVYFICSNLVEENQHFCFVNLKLFDCVYLIRITKLLRLNLIKLGFYRI